MAYFYNCYSQQAGTMTKQFLYDFISRSKYAVLATVNEDNEPEAATVGIAANEDLYIIFDTLDTSRKFRNLLSNPKTALVITIGEETIQYEGQALLHMPAGDTDAMLGIYLAAFPDGRKRQSDPSTVYFTVKPEWIRFSSFANEEHVEEIEF